MAVSGSGDHLACGLSSGSIVFWSIQSKEEGKGFGNGWPVVTTYWSSPEELAVATQNSLYIHNITTGETLDSFPIPECVRGVVYLEDRSKFLVGPLQLSSEVGQKGDCFVAVKWTPPHGSKPGKLKQSKRQPPAHTEQLLGHTLVGWKIVCRNPARRVQLFDVHSYKWIGGPPLLDTTTSMAVSLNRNLVVGAKDSIQIFSMKILECCEARSDVHPSHIYPLGENHIICVLQPTRCLALLELETLRIVSLDENTPSFRSSLTNPSVAVHGLVSHFGVSAVVEAWQSGTPLLDWTAGAEGRVPLRGWSPECTHVATVYDSPRREVRVEHAKDGITVANLPLEDTDFEMAGVYDLTFDSETRFHLNVEGPGLHVQIPHDVVAASPSGSYSHTITQGEPVHLSEPRGIPPYTLDANYEWVLDRGSRKICWISPGNLRRGPGGHFWAGLSLIMVGDDGVVRKVTFKDPDC